MAPVQKSEKPGIVEVQKWLAVLVGCITLATLVFSFLRAAVLDNKCLKDTAEKTKENSCELTSVKEDVTSLKAVLPGMQEDISTIQTDIKTLLARSSRNRN